ncbi:protein of unknown function [Paraburkholderia kururiensis]
MSTLKNDLDPEAVAVQADLLLVRANVCGPSTIAEMNGE